MENLEWWSGLQRGDANALREIYNAYFNPMMQYGLRISKESEIVEDALQDLFVELWKNHSGLGDTTSIKNYLFGSLRRRIIKKLQEQIKTSNHSLALELEADSSLNAEEFNIALEESSSQNLALQAAMKQLSKRQQEAIYLKYSEGLDYDQICETMELNYQSVRNLVSSAIKKLKSVLTISIIYVIICGMVSTKLDYLTYYFI